MHGTFIKELHDCHVGRACNNCNGSIIILLNRKLQRDSNVLRIHVLHVNKKEGMPP